MADYVALLSKDPDSAYGVDFPDFPGCVTAGETFEEARELALEALCLHIEGMVRDGEPIPSPIPAELITIDPANRDAIDFFGSSRKCVPHIFGFYPTSSYLVMWRA